MIDPLTLVGKIPTVLNGIGSLATLLKKPDMDPRVYQADSRQVFAEGGKIKGHNKYNAPSHEQGGMLVDDKGIPNPSGTNEIEKKESKYTYTKLPKKSSTYIFNPEDSLKVDSLVKKYKKSEKTNLDKATMELEIHRVEQKNEMKKANTKKKYSNGGKIKKYNLGGPLSGIGLTPETLMTLNNTLTQIKSGDMSGLMITPQGGVNTTTPATQPPLPVDDKAGMTPQGRQIAKASIGTNPLKTLDTLRNVGFAANSLQLLARAEKEDPIMTDYSRARSRMNEMDSSMRELREQVAQSSNQLRAINRNRASSANTFANNEAQRVANLTRSLSDISLQERGLANNIAAQRAGFEANAARDNAQTLRQNRINNQMNQAQNRNIKRQIGADIMAEIDRRSTIKSNRRFADVTTKEGFAILKNMFPNFTGNQADVAILQKYQRGEPLTTAEQKRMEDVNLMKARV